MFWSSGVGTVAWPLWIGFGAVIELYNFIMFWSGLFLVLTADEYTYGFEVITFWNWLMYPARWAAVNSLLYICGTILTIVPALGLIPTWLMWWNMLSWGQQDEGQQVNEENRSTLLDR